MSARPLWARQEAPLAEMLAELLDASGVTDYEPASMTMVPVAGGHDVYVVSRAHGRVRIGTLTYDAVKALLYPVAASYADELEAKRRRPLERKAEKKTANMKRAVELHEAGHSPNRIAQLMTDERGIRTDPRTVRAWLAEARTRMDRDRSDCP